MITKTLISTVICMARRHCVPFLHLFYPDILQSLQKSLLAGMFSEQLHMNDHCLDLCRDHNYIFKCVYSIEKKNKVCVCVPT